VFLQKVFWFGVKKFIFWQKMPSNPIPETVTGNK